MRRAFLPNGLSITCAGFTTHLGGMTLAQAGAPYRLPTPHSQRLPRSAFRHARGHPPWRVTSELSGSVAEFLWFELTHTRPETGRRMS